MDRRDLLNTVRSSYPTTEYPALHHQIERWTTSRPLAGAAVLDATPVFNNTLAKYAALVAAGAHVTVSAHRAIPGDPAVIAILPDLGIAVADEPTLAHPYDVVFDCAGTHTDVPSRHGYVELTRSGVAAYTNSAAPVLIADAGRLKRIETTLGTADGFLRAMAQLGHPVGPDDSVLVFGGGKVGAGVVYGCRALSAQATLVDPAAVEIRGVPRVDPADHASITAAIQSATVIVAATGLSAALEPWHEQLFGTTAVLANMGATDEFGPRIPPAAALNSKVAVNFALAEPTQLRYLDPTMALSNACGVELLTGTVPPGPNDPPAALEEAILAVVRQRGSITEELESLRL